MQGWGSAVNTLHMQLIVSCWDEMLLLKVFLGICEGSLGCLFLQLSEMVATDPVQVVRMIQVTLQQCGPTRACRKTAAIARKGVSLPLNKGLGQSRMGATNDD